jgi:hypothetical protein
MHGPAFFIERRLYFNILFLWEIPIRKPKTHNRKRN